MSPLLAEAKPPKECETVLRNQMITPDGPGTILRDFETFVHILAARNPKVSPKHQFLSIDLVKEINARLAQPLTVKVKRPLQSSYPNLTALYLILRATRIGYVDMTTRHPVLRLDLTLLAAWRALNPTEQWFALFEAWFIYGDAELLGEQFSTWSVPALVCARWYFHIPETGLKITPETEDEAFYGIGNYGVAFLRMLGLVTVKERPAKEGRGWEISRIHRTAFGDALVAYADYFYESNLETWREQIRAGTLLSFFQAGFQPFFPEWQQSLVVSETREFHDGTFTFKVARGAGVWRRLKIPAQLTLNELALGILRAFHFDNEHLYRFCFRDQYGRTNEINHPMMEDMPNTTEVRIGDLPLKPGMSLEFLYDFGDWWQFDVRLEAADEPDPYLTQVEVIEEKGDAPIQYPEEEEEARGQ